MATYLNSAYSRNRQDRSEKNELDRSSSSFFMLLSRRINSKEPILLANVAWARIFKRLRSPGIDSEELIPPTYVTWRANATSRVVVMVRQAGNRFPAPLKVNKYGLWRAGTITLFLLGS
jgi:hypothetical protein